MQTWYKTRVINTSLQIIKNMKTQLIPGFYRKTIITVFFLSFFTVLHAQHRYIIKGKIEGLAKT